MSLAFDHVNRSKRQLQLLPSYQEVEPPIPALINKVSGSANQGKQKNRNETLDVGIAD